MTKHSKHKHLINTPNLYENELDQMIRKNILHGKVIKNMIEKFNLNPHQ